MNFMSHVRAGFPALWIQTQEPMRTISEWSSQAKQAGYKCFSWDCSDGIKEIGNGFCKPVDDPVEAVGFLTTINQKGILFLENFHRFLRGDGAILVIQKISNLVDQYKASLKSLVVLAPVVDIPIELSKIFTTINFDLPTKEDLKKMLLYMAESTAKPLPSEKEQDAILEAGKGLSAFEFENALALSLVVKKKFDPQVIIDQKTQLIKKNASLMLEKFGESLENLGGLENLKQFCLKIVNSPHSRGVLLLGTPGRISAGLKSNGV